jgi:hypothetical protein
LTSLKAWVILKFIALRKLVESSNFNLSLDELRDRVKRIKSEVDGLNDLLERLHFFDRTGQEKKRADGNKITTAEFHD